MILPSLGLGLASCAGTPSSKRISGQTPKEVLDASADPVAAAHDDVVVDETTSGAPTAPAPTFDPLLPPLPASSITSRSQYTPPPNRPAPPCASGKGWDGVGCVSTTCARGSRFEVWRGCIACGFFGCDSNPERRDFFAEDDDGGGSEAPFNREAAKAALASLVPSMCKRADGPTGSGHAKITFHPSGAVEDVRLDAGPFADTPVGRCIVTQLRSLRIPKFYGGPVSVGRAFSIDK